MKHKIWKSNKLEGIQEFIAAEDQKESHSL